ncbi:AGE family epimerase/isomerase [Affinirhizobium pseudoryzae]|uniref:AGE family epimerase/isomerase n=1 Tax=Allorhizobium pseudoryzae TaxID=379684 RepID=UPI0013EA90A0|nr:AGE family epimerase/isomerase [Allorhizobium pseudoryzae]
MSATISQILNQADHFQTWLHEQAFPLWQINGFRGQDGGFVETIDLAGSPTNSHRRGRIHPRQIYCFAEAGSRGWSGNWQPLVIEGLQYFDRVYRRSDGFYGALASAEGELVDASFDLYNQAFAILAFCYTAKVYPSLQQEMGERASRMLSSLRQNYAHGHAGFHEAIPARLPLCSNPHMHLFEAALACEEMEGFKQSDWRDLADEIAYLCMSHFIDAETGGLREFFNADWTPYDGEKGRIMEPGHQFEWAWLLARWGERRGNEKALAHSKRLFDIGEAYGICGDRKVAVMSLLDDFSVHDDLARLWPQTEWLKSAIRLAVLSEGQERARYLRSASSAADALNRFLAVPTPGLWRDKMMADGRFIDEAAPASSFYHIVCAIYELEYCLNTLEASAL